MINNCFFCNSVLKIDNEYEYLICKNSKCIVIGNNLIKSNRFLLWYDKKQNLVNYVFRPTIDGITYTIVGNNELFSTVIFIDSCLNNMSFYRVFDYKKYITFSSEEEILKFVKKIIKLKCFR